jgi:hypothetical protein
MMDADSSCHPLQRRPAERLSEPHLSDQITESHRRNEWHDSISQRSKLVRSREPTISQPRGSPISQHTNSGFKLRRDFEHSSPSVEVRRTWRESRQFVGALQSGPSFMSRLIGVFQRPA